MNNLTEKQKACNTDTWEHINRVRHYLNKCISILLYKGEQHDQSKLNPPEVDIFAEYTPKLALTTFGSKEYNEYKEEMKIALDHHYANNRHHPEFFKNGIEDMNLLDILEMFCDWKSSSERHHDGNLRKSIEINGNRFGISPQLIKILENTISVLEFNLD